jgi:cytochrome c-type protein NapC
MTASLEHGRRRSLLAEISRLWQRFHKTVFLFPVAGLGAVFVAGIVFWGGLNWGLELTNTETFCISCHEMEEFLYKEYKTTVHYANRTGVRASCPDCHVPRGWFHKMARKVTASNELFHWMRGSISTKEKFEKKKLELAQHVWANMRQTNSRECRNCHEFSHMNAAGQALRAFLMHKLAEDWGKTCIDCHQGISHTLAQGNDKDAIMDELHDRMEAQGVECRLCHETLTRAPPGDGWD